MSAVTEQDEGVEITVTPAAASEAVSLMEAEGIDPAEAGLRLFVQQGGCAGLSYGMRFELEPDDDDRVFLEEGLRVFVDPASLRYIGGVCVRLRGGFAGSGVPR